MSHRANTTDEAKGMSRKLSFRGRRDWQQEEHTRRVRRDTGVKIGGQREGNTVQSELQRPTGLTQAIKGKYINSTAHEDGRNAM